ncbi:Alpha-D-glucose-1-phosphate phosphatase YihX [Pseudovibrio axinellae]|uniref:Alpha-D-glucose-1-phosphate phosphatase YihX n=1 Tax=Pseudovibrio axinellae TaxID=989403 RepID=A0A161XIC3_9HYPH|nr:HAD family phosphatase [Pseudovibrio axinellae]KZL21734.1 Alpha-D-glucose-1-phosphate phosphatase YihX [Pseudovibrio axinellae]SEQ21377.1 putative hydrolase of the HAD superfamily [Pseudovibrio axinellae]
MQISFVIFDMDNVLYDYDHPKRLTALSKMTGRSKEDIDRTVFAGPEENTAEEGTPNTAEGYLAQYQRLLEYPISRETWVDIRRDMMTEWPDMLAHVEAIKQSHEVALLTNNGMMLQDALYEIAPALEPIFGDRGHASAEFGTRKPDPNIYLTLCEKYGFKPEESLFVDDRLDNVEGAREAGLTAYQFTTEPAFASYIRTLGLID